MVYKKADLDFLRSLVREKDSQVRNKLLCKASNSNLKLLFECAKNLLCGNIKISDRRRRNIQCHKDHIRVLASKKINKTKKIKLMQTGGFLPGFLSILTPIVLSSIAELLV
jgi:hypothetical protein